jgi:hypothetical protein
MVKAFQNQATVTPIGSPQKYQEHGHRFTARMESDLWP